MPLDTVADVDPPWPGLTTNAAIPFPVRLTVCGLFAALSVMVSVPVRLPVAEGVNVTEIVHDAFIAKLAPQFDVALKSPLAAMLAMVSEPFPEFVSVTV